MEAFFIETHLETVFINFSNLDFFTDSWTYLIVLAVTLGFWRIQSYFHRRASAATARARHFSHSSASLFSDSQIQHDEPGQGFDSIHKPAETVREPSLHLGVLEGDQVGGFVFTTRGKFALYVEENNDDEGGDDVESNNFDVDCSCSVREEVASYKGGLSLVTRRESWYDYQDLMVFDGSVVKLWEAQKLGYPLLEKVKVSGRLFRVF